MTMIQQVLVVVVAVGLGVDAKFGTPNYKRHVRDMDKALRTLQDNVLSMGDKIPLLTDFRRHYAEVVYVVHYHGRRASCTRKDYSEDYYKYLNVSAPEAINNPQKVVDEITFVHDVVHKNITELKELIDACVQDDEVCNELVAETVGNSQDQYGGQTEVVIAASRVAHKLNARNDQFEKVSKDLKAHQYVISSPEDLEDMVNTVTHLYEVLLPYRCVVPV